MSNSFFERIYSDPDEGNGINLLAILIPASFSTPGVTFFTERQAGQQLAFMRHKKGVEIKPHRHNLVPRKIKHTDEVLIIRRGRMRCDIYDYNGKLVCTKTLHEGDLLLLCGGGHGFEALEDCEFFEVKQGPYLGDKDKEYLRKERA